MTSFLSKFTLKLAFLLMGLGLLACQSPGSLKQYSGSLEAEKVSVDRITYVNSAGDVFTIKGDGSDRQQLTGGTQVSSGPIGPFMGQGIDFDNFHAWPTWSPDGTKLAVSRVRASGAQDA